MTLHLFGCQIWQSGVSQISLTLSTGYHHFMVSRVFYRVSPLLKVWNWHYIMEVRPLSENKLGLFFVSLLCFWPPCSHRMWPLWTSLILKSTFRLKEIPLHTLPSFLVFKNREERNQLEMWLTTLILPQDSPVFLETKQLSGIPREYHQASWRRWRGGGNP